MPGVVQHTRDTLRKAAAAEAASAGPRRDHAVRHPAAQGRRSAPGATDPDGILNVAVSATCVAEVGDELVVMADLCLDEFTDHGHCGVLAADGGVDNDATLGGTPTWRWRWPRPGSTWSGRAG